MKGNHVFRRALADLTPPLVRRAVGRWRSNPGAEPITFHGDFATWEDAVRASEGYDKPEILVRTRAAILKVKRGEAAFERDSVVFDRMEYCYPLLAGLLRTAAHCGRLCVLDFGGSLGSSYYHCRPFLSPVRNLRWSVVEQAAHIECGRKDFADDHLRFYEDVDECVRAENPNLLLMSGVLQCLPAPYDTLHNLLQRRLPHVIIDRTAFLEGKRDRLTVQRVPEWIYPATYPAWFLNEARLLAACRDYGYRIIADFPALDTFPIPGGSSYHKGFILDAQS